MDAIAFSIIIPALNEEAHIGGVLESIRKSVGGRFLYEVILVDNGSSDQTFEIARESGALCIKAPDCTISSLRNIGAKEANSNCLIFLDADVYVGNDWGERIGSVVEALNREPDTVTGSLYAISSENNWIEVVWFAPRCSQKEVNYINGGHLIVLKSLFLKVGGFDPALETGEDYEFCARARAGGARIKNDTELRVVHAGYPKNLRSFFARERWHARGDYKSLKSLMSSKPALVSLLNLFMMVICMICLATNEQEWLTFLVWYIFFLAGISLTASIHRSGSFWGYRLWGAILLYMVYFTARTVSMVDILIRSLAAQPASTSKLG